MASLAFPTIAKQITLSDGTEYGYVKIPVTSAGKPTLLFLHGFPSAAYDWRHQIEFFGKKGYGLVVPDLPGYGDTVKPTDLKAYSMKTIGRQVDELLEKEGIEKVVGIAHDWGCALLSSMAQRHPSRFSSLAFLAVGYAATGFGHPDELNALSEQLYGYSIFGYWFFHGAEDAAAVIESHLDSYDSLVYPQDPNFAKVNICPPGKAREWVEGNNIGPRPDWLTAEELQTHRKILEKGGYTGPLNWYKQNLAGISPAEQADLSDEERRLTVPTLFVRAEKDYICVADLMEQGMRPWVENLTVASCDSAHWLQLEKPQEVNKIIEDFLN